MRSLGGITQALCEPTRIRLFRRRRRTGKAGAMRKGSDEELPVHGLKIRDAKFL